MNGKSLGGLIVLNVALIVALTLFSFFTPQASSAYSIAQEFRERGKTVIGGGMHPSQIPEEAVEHFDAICVGEAEEVWGTILSDLEKLGK